MKMIGFLLANDSSSPLFENRPNRIINRNRMVWNGKFTVNNFSIFNERAKQDGTILQYWYKYKIGYDQCFDRISLLQFFTIYYCYEKKSK